MTFRICQLEFSHILHYESLAEEWPQFLSSAGVLETFQLPWENKGAMNNLKSYFDIISADEKNQLKEKFAPDFEMFGYKIDDEF